MLRTSLLAVLVLSASACATSSGRLAKNPYTFPKREQLERVAHKPRPETLYSEQVAQIETWTVTDTRDVVSQAVFAGEAVFTAQTRQALAQRAGKAVLSDALTCVAQELARFRATTAAAPSLAVERFMAARCGSSYASGSSFLSLESDAPEDTVRARFEEKFPELIGRVLDASPAAIGVGYARVGTQTVAVVTSGQSRIDIPALKLTPDEQGQVLIEGKLRFDAEAIVTLINQGPLGFARCTRDETAALPAFRFSCSMAAGDSTAWIQVMAQGRGRLLAETVLEALATRPGQDVNTLSVVQKAAQPVASSEQLESHALAAINEIRREAQLSPLVALNAQAASVREVAPQFFNSVYVSHDQQASDTIAMGLLAGWDVDSAIRGGSFVSSLVPASTDVHAWVRELVSSPVGRQTLLDPMAQAIALGGVLNQKPALVGGMVFTYAFFEGHDHAKDANLLAERIRNARAAAGVPAAKREMNLEASAWREARKVLSNGVDPEVAFHNALNNAALRSESNVRGYVLITTQPDAMELPKEILSKRVTNFAVASTHYQPEGSHWAVQVLFILMTEEPGGDV